MFLTKWRGLRVFLVVFVVCRGLSLLSAEVKILPTLYLPKSKSTEIPNQ